MNLGLAQIGGQPVQHLAFEGCEGVPPNRLRFGLDSEELRPELTRGGAGATFTLVPFALRAQLEAPHLPAYVQRF